LRGADSVKSTKCETPKSPDKFQGYHAI